MAASSIQAKLNWKLDPCTEFKNFSCSPLLSNGEEIASLRAIRSAQEAVDMQLQRKSLNDTISSYHTIYYTNTTVYFIIP